MRSAHTVFICFVFIWEQTATCDTYSINWLDFITEMKSVYSAVRTGSLNKAVCASSLKGSSTSLQSLEERINPFDFFLIFIFFFQFAVLSNVTQYQLLCLLWTEIWAIWKASKNPAVAKAVSQGGPVWISVSPVQVKYIVDEVAFGRVFFWLFRF